MYESRFAYLIKDYDRSEWVMAQSIVYPLTVAHVRKINVLYSKTKRLQQFKKKC